MESLHSAHHRRIGRRKPKPLCFSFGERCLLCGDLIYRWGWPPYPLCLDCDLKARSTRIDFFNDVRRCRVCSLPLISEDGICTRCRDKSFCFLSNHSLFRYEGETRELIYRYKFKGRKSLAYYYSDIVAEAYMRSYKGFIVVPVPFRPSSRRKRGWDQVQRIVDIINCKYGIPARKLLLRKGGAPQKALDYDGRSKNLHGRIHVRSPDGVELPQKLLLLDDVFTTGATADECSRVLKTRGVDIVKVLTLALD